MDKTKPKLYCLEIRGDFACFTRPELKVERVSYDVITPSCSLLDLCMPQMNQGERASDYLSRYHLLD